MRHGVFLPPFGPLADPGRLLDLARGAEERGWDGVFLWDHILRRETPDVLDTWVALGALAAATSRLHLGPMVTPVTRRRPVKLAREIQAVDLVAGGRLIMGVGLGVDTSGELSRLGEVTGPRDLGARLDEGLSVITDLLDGGTVHHRGPWFTADGVDLGAPGGPRGRPPIWCAARGDARRPVRRAARYEGLFPIDLDHDRYQRMLELVSAERGDLDGFDVCLTTPGGQDPPSWADGRTTWLLQQFPALPDADRVAAVIEAGPPR